MVQRLVVKSLLVEQPRVGHADRLGARVGGERALQEVGGSGLALQSLCVSDAEIDPRVAVAGRLANEGFMPWRRSPSWLRRWSPLPDLLTGGGSR